MSIAISKIYKEAHREGMPLSAPGIILYSLEASIVNTTNKNKAYKYKVPYFTDAKLLTHDQLERINRIIEEKHDLSIDSKPVKDVSIVDISKYHLDESEYPSLDSISKSSKDSQSHEQSHEQSKEEQRKDIINQLEKEWNEDVNESIKNESNKQYNNKSKNNEIKKMSKRNKLNKHKQCH